ncbi:MAG: hypothetical protein QM742_14170 [Aquabacterium sp.]
MRQTLRRTGLSAVFSMSASATIALACLGAMQASQAQSAYTLSVLAKPSGAGSFLPTSLDNQGVVRGGMYQVNGYTPDTAATNCFLYCPLYSVREAYWPAATSSGTVTGKAGVRDFFGLMGGGSGTQLGAVSSAKTLDYPTWVPHRWLPLPVTQAGDFHPRPTHVLVPGGTPQALFPEGPAPLSILGANDAGTLVGARGAINAQGVPYSIPVVWRQGARTDLPVIQQAPQMSALALDVNESGVIVGATTDWVPSTSGGFNSAYRPTLWTDGQPTYLGGQEMAELMALAINESGQVMIGPQIGTSFQFNPVAYLWSNGAAMQMRASGKSVHPLAMNDKGVVVGCTRTLEQDPSITYTRADLTAFIWRDGKLLQLENDMATKGLRLPTGTRLGCPFAINNQGSILAFYYKLSAPDTITWVRINAKP